MRPEAACRAAFFSRTSALKRKAELKRRCMARPGSAPGDRQRHAEHHRTTDLRTARPGFSSRKPPHQKRPKCQSATQRTNGFASSPPQRLPSEFPMGQVTPTCHNACVIEIRRGPDLLKRLHARVPHLSPGTAKVSSRAYRAHSGKVVAPRGSSRMEATAVSIWHRSSTRIIARTSQVLLVPSKIPTQNTIASATKSTAVIVGSPISLQPIENENSPPRAHPYQEPSAPADGIIHPKSLREPNHFETTSSERAAINPCTKPAHCASPQRRPWLCHGRPRLNQARIQRSGFASHHSTAKQPINRPTRARSAAGVARTTLRHSYRVQPRRNRRHPTASSKYKKTHR